jgi:hypothetical protein
MMTYSVNFFADGEEHTRGFAAVSAGQAFSLCLEKFAGAKLIQAWREGGYLDGYGITVYQPPSFAKVEAAAQTPKGGATEILESMSDPPEKVRPRPARTRPANNTNSLQILFTAGGPSSVLRFLRSPDQESFLRAFPFLGASKQLRRAAASPQDKSVSETKES